MVEAVSVYGTDLQVNLTTQVGQPYNGDSIEKDVRELWRTGRFEDIRVETTQDTGGIAVVFRVLESTDLRLHEIHFDPPSYALRLAVPEGTLLTRLRAHEIAREAQRQLILQGYVVARVDWDLVPWPGERGRSPLAGESGRSRARTRNRVYRTSPAGCQGASSCAEGTSDQARDPEVAGSMERLAIDASLQSRSSGIRCRPPAFMVSLQRLF